MLVTVADHGDVRHHVRTRLLYATAVVAYIVITLFTKRLLTWNLAMLYFIVTLDLLPRLYRRVTGRFGATNEASL